MLHKLSRAWIFILLTFSVSAIWAAENIYGLDSSLTQVVNWERFANDLGKYSREEKRVKPLEFSAEQMTKLLENGFFVSSDRRSYAAEQFFHIYESDHYGSVPKIPNFVTVDCVLQAYHLYFSFLLRTMEEQKLYYSVQFLTRLMLESSVEQYYRLADPDFKAAAVKNIAYFLVTRKMLHIDGVSTYGRMNETVPDEAVDIANAEFEKVKSHAARESSDIFPGDLDYSQFIPRGHYTRDAKLESYFLAMMWFGLGALPARANDENGMNVRCDECIRQTLLMTDALFRSNEYGRAPIGSWQQVYRTTSAFAGQSDFLTPHDIHRLIADIYSDSYDITELEDAVKFEKFASRFEKLESPRIKHKAVGMASGVQFRLMGQRYILDSEILQTLSEYPVRSFPRGLDVFAVLGSDRAADILDQVYNQPEQWDRYLPLRDSLELAVQDWKPENDHSSIYHSWLDVLRELIAKPDPAAPLFAQNTAWLDKELTTALASWAEGRHDIILYANASWAEGEGGMEKPPLPKGYVEPVPKVFAKLEALVQLTRDVLREQGCRIPDADVLAVRLADLIGFLEACADKELRGETLMDADYIRIQYIGSELEQLSTDIVNLDRNMPAFNWEGQKVEMEPHKLRGWFEITGPDRDLAVIADVHNSGDQCLEVAVGHVDEIYVIVPIEDELRITRGGVFSYYEFPYPAGHRLTDEAWQEMLKRDRAPDRPVWTSSFLAE
ncbi:DUF3160 domain-containing protein [bacterium]|nr:DUF3160 domain-containing protein [bacterium]